MDQFSPCLGWRAVSSKCHWRIENGRAHLSDPTLLPTKARYFVRPQHASQIQKTMFEQYRKSTLNTLSKGGPNKAHSNGRRNFWGREELSKSLATNESYIRPLRYGWCEQVHNEYFKVDLNVPFLDRQPSQAQVWQIKPFHQHSYSRFFNEK